MVDCSLDSPGLAMTIPWRIADMGRAFGHAVQAPRCGVRRHMHDANACRPDVHGHPVGASSEQPRRSTGSDCATYALWHLENGRASAMLSAPGSPTCGQPAFPQVKWGGSRDGESNPGPAHYEVEPTERHAELQRRRSRASETTQVIPCGATLAHVHRWTVAIAGRFMAARIDQAMGYEGTAVRKLY
jgi:hypothetical protein